ncbi:MAG: SDR family NAD(P)-dependent oxidoreductase, partial [Bacteroidia bacterium]
QRGSGKIIGISSVAGDRGRASNYLYGSAKAGLTAYLSGLRNRLASKGVHVMTVKPGFVRTAMTENMDLPPVITGEPSKVAKDIIRSVRRGRNVIYTLWMWRYIMLIIRTIPERIFKKLSF